MALCCIKSRATRMEYGKDILRGQHLHQSAGNDWGSQTQSVVIKLWLRGKFPGVWLHGETEGCQTALKDSFNIDDEKQPCNQILYAMRLIQRTRTYCVTHKTTSDYCLNKRWKKEQEVFLRRPCSPWPWWSDELCSFPNTGLLPHQWANKSGQVTQTSVYLTGQQRK